MWSIRFIIVKSATSNVYNLQGVYGVLGYVGILLLLFPWQPMIR